MITQNDWIKYFPYSEPRKEQIDLINFALNSFINENKEFVIIEAGRSEEHTSELQLH